MRYVLNIKRVFKDDYIIAGKYSVGILNLKTQDYKEILETKDLQDASLINGFDYQTRPFVLILD